MKYKKAPNPLVVPKPQIAMRDYDGKPVEKIRVVADNRFTLKGKELRVEMRLFDPETNEEVKPSAAINQVAKYKYQYINNEGRILEKIKNEEGKEVWPINYFAVKPDGTEEQVSPFKRTNLIDIPEENWIPSTAVDDFIIDKVYEIFGDNPISIKKLYEEAERRMKADQIGITTFSFGGFSQSYAFLCPYFQQGQFVWLMKLSKAKLGTNHLQDPPTEAKIPIVEAPTLKTLPPLQALVLTAKA